MKKTFVILLAGLCLAATLAFAGNGDLVVTGNISAGGVIGSTNGGIKFPDGTTQMTAAMVIPSIITRLQIANNATTPNTQIDIAADAVCVTDGSGHYVLLSGVSHTINAATIGANGIDVGALATSTWYFIYQIYNPTTATKAGLISISATAPTLPVGYTYKKLVGCAATNTLAYFKIFSQIGNHWVYDEYQQVSSGTTSQNWTAQNCSAFIPPVSTMGFFQVHLEAGTGQFLSTALRRNGSASTIGHEMATIGGTGGTYTMKGVANDWVNTDASQIVQLNVAQGSTWYLRVLGFELNI